MSEPATGMRVTPPRRYARHNPWYILATLNGEQILSFDEELHAKNRRTWNKWMAQWLSDEDKEKLVSLTAEGKINLSMDELTHFSNEELAEITEKFRLRKSPKGLYNPLIDGMDIQNTDFNNTVSFSGFVFPGKTYFTDCKFEEHVILSGACFLNHVNFDFALCRLNAHLESIYFSKSASFANFNCLGSIHLTNAHFTETCNFNKAILNGTFFNKSVFEEEAYFEMISINEYISFEDALFNSNAHFKSSNFSSWLKFNNTTFSALANFDDAIFSSSDSLTSISFNCCKFNSLATFTNAKFAGETTFDNATFSDYTKFAGAAFENTADFNFATFKEGADFEGTTFKSYTNFVQATFHKTINFINTKFQSKTDFSKVIFTTTPPNFNGASLHDGTIFNYAEDAWPTLPKPTKETEEEIKKVAATHKSAYERLKQEMEKQKKHEDELFFFAKEMDCKAIIDGFPKNLPFWGYKLFSDYGRSFTKPIVSFVFSFLLSTLLLLIFAFSTPETSITQTKTLAQTEIEARLNANAAYYTPIETPEPIKQEMSIGKTIAISFANSVWPLGLRKDLFENEIKAMNLWGHLISFVQGLLGFAFIFLIGLALRNKFRMK